MRFNGIVIGGGPAGMFAAITAAASGQKVLLIEKNDRLGKKLLITGKGRCNVTNYCTAEEALQNIPRNSKFLFSALNAFPPDRIISFFDNCGCELKVERGNRVFPASDKSASIRDTLKKALKVHGVSIANERAINILTESNRIVGVSCSERAYQCSWVILSTGGISYPLTGSTGDGYRMAQEVGHSVTPLTGSLVPLVCNTDICAPMQGLSLRNIGVKLVNRSGKIIYQDFGELLFTHFGVSGPTVLSASAHLKEDGCRLLIDLKPALDVQKLNDRILRDLEKYQNRAMENALSDLLPRSMIPVVLRCANIMCEMPAHSLKKEQRKNLVEIIKGFSLDIFGKRPIEEAIITSGGINVSEINPKTMESKIISGLHFAGEIIDCDAYTGGYNLQIAWSTAYAAGTAVSKCCQR